MKIKSKYEVNGIYWYYEILDDGYKIYSGEESPAPLYHQYEPFIPDHSKSYEENAIQMCKELSDTSNVYVPFTMTKDMYEELQSNVDYLMLLNDSNSLEE